MKKVLLMFFFSLATLISCTNNTNTSSQKYEQDIIELAKQYRFNNEIDTVNLYSLKAKVFQTIFDSEGLCSEISNGEYKWYNGQMLYYMSNEQLYDDKIINKNVIYLGTYRYEGRDYDYHVVPLYCDIEVYKNGIIDNIKEIQNSNDI